MRTYLDTSGLVKLIVAQPESAAVRDYLRSFADDAFFTAALARTELVRAVASAGRGAVAQARTLLGALDTATLSSGLLDDAANLPPRELRSLDAISLSAALRAVTSLWAVVTYDMRMASAAVALGLTTAAPS